MYEIIKDAPIPKDIVKRGDHLRKYPIGKLLIGESFKFPLRDLKLIKNAAEGHRTRHKTTGWDYAWQKIDPLMGQLWRIK